MTINKYFFFFNHADLRAVQKRNFLTDKLIQLPAFLVLYPLPLKNVMTLIPEISLNDNFPILNRSSCTTDSFNFSC